MLSCDITPSYRLTIAVHTCILTTGAHRAWHPSKALSRLLSECHNDYYIIPSIKKKPKLQETIREPSPDCENTDLKEAEITDVFVEV